MQIQRSTERYEAWLSERVALIDDDLEEKHARMKEGLFPFLRATFYRFAETVTSIVPDAIGGPRILSVGDLHLENFGTWRDAEGRLVWGVNDFDEACELPATTDLVRLATSARLATSERRLALDPKSQAEAMLDGYRAALEQGGAPIVLAESRSKLRAMAARALKDPDEFWGKLDRLEPIETVPQAALDALASALPPDATPTSVSHRVAGLGSLGRPRLVSVVTWRGAKIARETKPLAPSACVWAGLCEASAVHPYRAITERSIRCSDPFLRIVGDWVVRRLAPDCTKIDVGELPKERDEAHLLKAMGWETANVHLGSGDPAALGADLKARGKNWLYRAAERMAASVNEDWEAFRRG